MGKAKFNREAAFAYAKMNGIEMPEQATEAAIVRILKEHIGKRKDTCGDCSTKDDIRFIKDTDTFCPFCGGDCSEDGTGGFDPKKVKVVDKTEKGDPKVEEKPAKEKKSDNKLTLALAKKPEPGPEDEGPKPGDPKVI